MRARVMMAVSACALALGARAEVRAVTPTVWEGGNTNSWQMKRHVAKLAEIRERGGAPIVFVGDSITHFWEMDRTWTNLLNVAGYDALNLGYGADRTEHVLWRITEGRELDGYKAKAVVLLIGTNNTGHNPLEKESPLDTERGIRKVVQVIREKQPEAMIIVTAIFPRGATADDPCRQRNAVVNTRLKDLVKEKNVVWCDLTKKFVEADGWLPRRLFPDLLHPVTPGYQIWFEGIRPYLDAALAGRPAPVAVVKEGAYVPIFDGKTLNGWKVVGGDAKFTVEDGCIKGEGMPSTLGINTFLATEKTYGDFDLKVEFCCESGNSGVQFRSETREKYDPKWDWNPFKEGLHKVFGYQAEITPGGGSTGRIYDEERRGYRHGLVWLDVNTPQARADVAEKSFRKGGWNEIRVRCEGPRIRTWVNGKPVADIYDDMSRSGFIGLQVHQQGPKKEGVEFKPMVVRFRNVRIKELPAPEMRIRAFATDPAVAAKCQNPGGTNEFTVIEMDGRTVIRLNGFEVSDTGAK